MSINYTFASAILFFIIMLLAQNYVWDLTPYHSEWRIGDSAVHHSTKPVFYPDPIKTPQEATEWFVQTTPLTKFEFLERPTENLLNQWVVLGIIIFLLFIVFSKQANPRKFYLLFSAGFSATKLQLLLREWNPVRHIFAPLFTLVYVASASMLILSLLPGFSDKLADPSAISPEFFTKVMLLIGAIVFFRIFMAWLLSYLFTTIETTTQFLANMLSHMLVFSVTSMILTILLIFVQLEILWFISLFVVALLLLLSLIRSLMIGLLEHSYSGLLLFLYLCALEIVPFLVLFKSIGLIST